MTRTTMALEPEILQMVRNLSAERGISLGDAVNQILRRGLEAQSPTINRNGFVVFAQAAPEAFGPNDVENALAEESFS